MIIFGSFYPAQAKIKAGSCFQDSRHILIFSFLNPYSEVFYIYNIFIYLTGIIPQSLISPGVMLANVILTQYLSGCIKNPPGLGIFKLKLSY